MLLFIVGNDDCTIIVVLMVCRVLATCLMANRCKTYNKLLLI